MEGSLWRIKFPYKLISPAASKTAPYPYPPTAWKYQFVFWEMRACCKKKSGRAGGKKCLRWLSRSLQAKGIPLIPEMARILDMKRYFVAEERQALHDESFSDGIFHHYTEKQILCRTGRAIWSGKKILVDDVIDTENLWRPWRIPGGKSRLVGGEADCHIGGRRCCEA